jgi:hypothetical protein
MRIFFYIFFENPFSLPARKRFLKFEEGLWGKVWKVGKCGSWTLQGLCTQQHCLQLEAGRGDTGTAVTQYVSGNCAARRNG